MTTSPPTAPKPKQSRRIGRRFRLLLSVLVLFGAVIGGITLFASGGNHRPVAVPGCTVAGPSGSRFTLTLEQGQNASIIAAVGLKVGLPDHAVTVALAAALQESQLRNLTYGDRDSVGLFQQRPSQGWGTRTQILDPVYASTAFYNHLAQVPGWVAMAVTDAAQTVQHSADPGAYTRWEPEARDLAIALTGEAPAAFTCRPVHFAGPAPAPGALAAAATNEMGSSLGTAVDTKVGWALASWTAAHSWQYHIRQVTFAGWIWTERSGRWTRTSAPSAAANAVQSV